jgi:hypothetical protein
MASSTGLLDFGAFPGASHATLVITGQTGILSTSLVGAWLFPDDTADHLAEEHLLEPLMVLVPKTSIVVGTGFTIHGYYTGPPESARISQKPGERDPMAFGKWNVAWVWV